MVNVESVEGHLVKNKDYDILRKRIWFRSISSHFYANFSVDIFIVRDVLKQHVNLTTISIT